MANRGFFTVSLTIKLIKLHSQCNYAQNKHSCYTGWTKSLCAPDDLYYNRQVHRDFLIALYYTLTRVPVLKCCRMSPGIWFLYTPVICTRLYSVLLVIWMSRPNTALPQHQGATGETYDESLDVKEIVPALGPSDPPTHRVQRAPCPAIKWRDPDHSLASKAERCHTCTAHTQGTPYFTLFLLT